MTRIVRAALKNISPLFVVVALFVITGIMACASQPPSRSETDSNGSDFQGKTIYDIAVSEVEGAARVTIYANEPLSYTAVKLQLPPGVVLYFQDTVLRGVQQSYTPESTLIKAIETSEVNGPRRSARIEISLHEDLPYTVARAETNVLAFFGKPVSKPEVETWDLSQPAAAVVAPEQAKQPKKPILAAQAVKPKPTATGVSTKKTKGPGWLNRLE